MGALRTQMIAEMRLRNFSPRTEESYVAAMVGLVKHYHRSPDQLTQDEIRCYLLHLKERGLLMTAYATGVRVSELVRLKVSDIDSERMTVKVEQGKGRKDRYTILSQRLLSELRTYWKEHRSQSWLFPNRKGAPLSIDYVPKTYNRAK